MIPALPIKVKNLDGTLGPETPAILDSGADVSSFPAAWAKSIGIKLDESECEEEEATTAGGTTIVWRYPQGLRLAIEGVEHWVKAEFCEKLDIPLLGRKDFFYKYKVTFDQRRRVFLLEAFPPSDAGS